MDDLDLYIQGALIRGERPGRIARELRRRGVPEADIERAFASHAGLAQRVAASRSGRWIVRLIGAGLFLPLAVFNVYYLFFWDAGWLISGLFWAVMLYGLMVMIVGDLGDGVLGVVRTRRADDD